MGIWEAWNFLLKYTFSLEFILALLIMMATYYGIGIIYSSRQPRKRLTMNPLSDIGASDVVIFKEPGDSIDGELNDGKVFEACDLYLTCKASKFKCSTSDGIVCISLMNGHSFTDRFDKVPILWIYAEYPNKSPCFIIKIDEKYRDKVFDAYMRSVVEFYDEMMEKHKDKRTAIIRALSSRR